MRIARGNPLRIVAVAALALVVVAVAATWRAGNTGSEAAAVTASSGSASPDAPASTTSGTAPTSTAPTTTAPTTTAPTTTTTLAPLEAHPLPEGSGEGRRVVFSVGAQRMWWVEADGVAVRTAAVSGRERTPELGTFQVYSRSEQATGLDGSSMRWFVRFTKGPNGWAIGFHDIPIVDGAPAQTEEQLGTPLSHGCIRQGTEDAQFTWEFLQLGDTVVVVA